MKISMYCKCGSSFTIDETIIKNDRVTHRESVYCNNCGKPLPDSLAFHTVEFFQSFSTLCKAAGDEVSFTVEADYHP